MKGLGRLIGNELFKLWKQTFVRVIAIIMLCLIAVYPLLAALLNWGLSSLDTIFGSGLESDLAFYEDQAELYAEEDMPIEARYYRVMADACISFRDEIMNGDSKFEWKYLTYGSQYLDAVLLCDAIELAASGEYTDDELRDSSYAYELAGNYFLEDEYGFSGDRNPDFNAAFFLDAYKANLETLRTMIRNASVASLLTDLVGALEEELASQKASLSEIEAELQKTPGDEYLLLKKRECELEITSGEQLLRAYGYLVSGENGPGTWQYRAVSETLSSALQSKKNSLPVSNAEYNAGNYAEYYGYESYEQYVALCEQKMRNVDEPITVILYALEHNIPLPYLLEDSVKLGVESLIVSMVGWIFFLAVIIGGVTVASEHSRGTIRLLLIRPRTRTKILLSKLLAGGIAVGAVSLFAFLWAILFGILTHGDFDLFVPTLLYQSGSVIEVNAILCYLRTYFMALLPILFYFLVSFFFSVVCRRTVAAFGLTIASNTVLGWISSLCLYLWTYKQPEVLRYLPFPYMELSSFRVTLTDYYCMMNLSSLDFSGLFSMLSASTASMTFGLYPVVGVLWFLALGALLGFFSFLIFRRRQIKS